MPLTITVMKMTYPILMMLPLFMVGVGAVQIIVRASRLRRS